MIRTVTKKIIAAALLAFSLLFSFITFGCSFFDFNNYSDVIFNIKTSRSAADSSSGTAFDFSDAFISVELRGEYSASKTQSLVPDTETQETQIIFSDIPVGKIIYVYAEIFKMIQNQNDESEKKIFYKGESEAKAIQEGGNQFTIKLLKQEQLIVEDETEENSEQETPEPQTQDPQTSQETPQQQTQDPQTQDPQGPQQQDPQTQDPQTSQETIEYIEIYISASGQRYDADTYNEGDEEHPFKYVDDAVSKIIAEGDSDSYWKILIDGETTGAPRGTSGTNASYGHIELPVEITTSNAKSIIITGATPHENWLTGAVPSDLDTINRGASLSSNSSLASGETISGAAIVVKTEVPVTFTNLKITGGYGINGGAMTINEGATVSLGDGVLITENRASKGGAIFNQGTLFIYGTAVIGDKDSSSFAVNDSNSVRDGNAANYANIGGGIYNGDTASTVSATSIIANLYLGYKPSSNGTPVPATLTGGIFFNSSNSGGGIANQRKSYVYMNSGIIKNNGVSQYGGGICNEDSGYIEISGGQIIHNSTSNTSSVPYGGGICNLYANSTIVFSGGTINENQAWATSSSTDGKGGGIYNCGKVFMYGTAVIGNKNANTPASETAGNYGNRANIGGGIFNEGSSMDYKGKLYIGYSKAQDGTPQEADLNGGIYYNYSKHASSTTTIGGGGIYNYSSSGGEFKMHSGTIAYNSTDDDGGGIWMHDTTIAGGGEYGVSIHDNAATGNGSAIYAHSGYKLTLSGNIEIPAEDNDSHDIYLAGTGNNFSKIYIAADTIGNFEAIITPASYDSSHQLVNSADGFTGDFEAECKSFRITPNPRAITNNGTEINSTIAMWIMGTDGKPFQAFDLGVMTNPAYSAYFSGSLPPSAPVEVANLTYSVDDSDMGTYALANTFELSESDAGGTGTHVIKILAETESDEYEFFIDYTIE